VARRKLQELQDEKVLQFWLAEVWDQPACSDRYDRNNHFH